MLAISQVIAHRGASAYAPENTLSAFKKAKALGAEWVEFDVMLSGDGSAVVFHDDSVERTTNGRGDVAKLSDEQLAGLDAGSWFSPNFVGEKIATFQQVATLLGELSLKANIEIKPAPGFIEDTTIAVMTEINQYWPTDLPETLVSSFELKALRLARAVAPDMQLGLLLHEWRDDWVEIAQELEVVSVHCNHTLLNECRITAIKQAGFLCSYLNLLGAFYFK